MMRNRNRTESGTSMIEFILLVPVWLPLILGTMWIGSAMVRGQQVTQTARDLASMYSRGVNFSSVGGAASSQTLSTIAQQLGSVTASGTGVVIFTTLTYVGNSVCASLNGTNGSTVYGVAPSSGSAGSHTANCTNWGKFVFTQQYGQGNTTLLTSKFGTAPTAHMDSNFNIPSSYYVTDSTYQSTFNLLQAPLELGQDGYQSGQPVYLVETYFSGKGQAGYASGGAYAYAVF
jgi:Flp pilus assembly protein TadG